MGATVGTGNPACRSQLVGLEGEAIGWQSVSRAPSPDPRSKGTVVTRRVLFEDVVGTRGDFHIMLVGPATDLNDLVPSAGNRGEPPDAVAYAFGIVVNVVDGMYGPLRVHIVLADRGARVAGRPPGLVADLEMSAKAALAIGSEEGDTGFTVFEPSLRDGAPLEICVTVLERTTVRESIGTVELPSAVEVQIGDPSAKVIDRVRDIDERWKDLIESDD